MKKETLLTSGIMLILWQLLASLFQNEFLLPAPVDVLQAMLVHAQRADFFIILFNTCTRTLAGCFVSLFCGAILGITAGLIPVVKRLVSPVHQLIKTIPNITYMILILIWLGQERSVSVIIFFILFPVFYAEFVHRTEAIYDEFKDVLHVYPVSLKYKWTHILFPLILPDVFQALKTGIGMGFKVCVMAEILSQVKTGIGRQMNIGRLNLDIASVFGWTLWVILLSLILQWIVTFVQKITCEK